MYARKAPRRFGDAWGLTTSPQHHMSPMARAAQAVTDGSYLGYESQLPDVAMDDTYVLLLHWRFVVITLSSIPPTHTER